MTKTNKDIFASKIFDLPLNLNGNFSTSLADVFSVYVATIKNFKGALRAKILPRVPIIEQQIDTINKAIDYYFKGLPGQAYNELVGGLKVLDKANCLPIQKTDLPAENYSYFRIRASDNRSLKRGDLFHIPFEIREKVNTQRYSIPGLPCLYLADSIYVCWEELDRPTLSKVHASRFDLSNSGFKLLYFNVSTNEIRKRCFPGKEKNGILINSIVSFLCYWPLLAACSIVVRKPNEIFKPEYIVPQLLLQWVVSTQKIDGILYRSNKVPTSNNNNGTFSNLVIPVQSIANTGFCKVLKSKVRLTTPISSEILEITGVETSSNKVDVADLRRVMYIELVEGEKSVYSETKFGKLENKLLKTATENIK